MDSQSIKCAVQNIGNQDDHKIGWIWSQKRDEVKAMHSEIKENVQGKNSDGKETRTQNKGLEQKEEMNIQPEQNEETVIQKTEERLLGTSRTTLSVPTTKS